MKRKLTPYQEEGVKMFLEKKRLCFDWATGSGKTIAAIESAREVQPDRLVVILPHSLVSQFKFVMQDQSEGVENLGPFKSIFVCESRTSEPIPRDAVVFCSIEILSSHAKEIIYYLNSGSRKMVICDEAHVLRSHKRVKKEIIDGREHWVHNNSRVAWFANITDCTRYLLLLSGTPIAKNRSNLWALLNYMDKGNWPSYNQFIVRYCGAVKSIYGYSFDKESIESSIYGDELIQRMKKYMHRVTEEEVSKYLPDLDFGLFHVPADNLLKLSKIKQEAALAELMESAQNSLEALLMLACERALKPTVDLIATETVRRTLVFVSRHKYAKMLADELRKHEELEGVPILCSDATMDVEERKELIDRYASTEGKCVMIVTLAAFSTGLDGMQCTEFFCYGMVPPTPEMFRQSMGRPRRLGGTEPRIRGRIVVPEGTYAEKAIDLLRQRLRDVQYITPNKNTEQLLDFIEDKDIFGSLLFGDDQ